MPVYEYVCKDCGVLSEKLRKMAEKDNPFKCPECDSMNTKKMISTFSGHVPVDGTNLRGSGKADFDRLVGQSAEARWEKINTEAGKKAAARAEFGQQALGRNTDGSYSPVSKEQIDKRKEGYAKFRHAKKHGEKIVHDG